MSKTKTPTRSRLRKKLKARGLTQRELAFLTEISEPEICRFVRGDRLPRLVLAHAICTVLRCKVDELWPAQYCDEVEHGTD